MSIHTPQAYPEWYPGHSGQGQAKGNVVPLRRRSPTGWQVSRDMLRQDSVDWTSFSMLWKWHSLLHNIFLAQYEKQFLELLAIFLHQSMARSLLAKRYKHLWLHIQPCSQIIPTSNFAEKLLKRGNSLTLQVAWRYCVLAVYYRSPNEPQFLDSGLQPF